MIGGGVSTASNLGSDAPERSAIALRAAIAPTGLVSVFWTHACTHVLSLIRSTMVPERSCGIMVQCRVGVASSSSTTLRTSRVLCSLMTDTEAVFFFSPATTRLVRRSNGDSLNFIATPHEYCKQD